MRALRVFPVDQTHGRGDEVEVAAGSESAGRACRPARQEHAALPLSAGTRTAIQRVCVCDVALREQCSPCVSRAAALKPSQSEILSAVWRTLKPLLTPYRTRARRSAEIEAEGKFRIEMPGFARKSQIALSKHSLRSLRTPRAPGGAFDTQAGAFIARCALDARDRIACISILADEPETCHSTPENA